MTSAVKQPISKKWRKKLKDGQAVLLAAKKGNLIELFKDFPKDMEVPEDILKYKNRAGNTFFHLATIFGHLDQVVVMAKELNLDIKPLLNEKNEQGNTFLHRAAFWGHLDQVTVMAKELGLDLLFLIKEKEIRGKTFYEIAKEKGDEEQAKKFRKDIMQIKAMQKMEDLAKKTEQYKQLPIKNIREGR